MRLFPKPPYPVLIARALRLRCPRCGEGTMFRGLFSMQPVCQSCGLQYEREGGYFLGSIYVNYGLTAAVTIAGYLILRLGFDIEGKWLLALFGVFCFTFPVFFFRYARALWLAMDCNFDPTAMRGDGVTQQEDLYDTSERSDEQKRPL